MKKVLITSSTISHLHHFHLPYIQALANDGWQVVVACGGTAADVPYAEEVIIIPFEKRLIGIRNLFACATLRRILINGHFDMVIMHTSLAAFYTRLAMKGMKERPYSINVVHGYLFDDQTQRVKALLLQTAEFFVAKQTDLILTMNAYDSAWTVNHPVSSQQRRIQGMGVDAAALYQTCTGENIPRKPGEFVLLYPAEFSKRKAQQTIIRALPHLPEKVKLILPGSGKLLHANERLAKKLGVTSRVCFPGYCANIGDYYVAADALVSASRSEGLPFHVIEGMLMGLPVIASKVKGNEDLVEDGVTGLLYPFGDCRRLAEAIEMLMANPQLAEDMGKQGQTRAQYYTLDSVFPRVFEAYTDWVLQKEQDIHSERGETILL